MLAYIHTYTAYFVSVRFPCIYVYIHTYTGALMRSQHNRRRLSSGTHTFIHSYMHTYMHTYIHTQALSCRPDIIGEVLALAHHIHSYIHTCIHTCIHTHIHTQALSCRPDIIGEDLALAFGTLQDNIPPFDHSEARRIAKGTPIV